jgi:nucleoside phosphorylase
MKTQAGLDPSKGLQSAVVFFAVKQETAAFKSFAASHGGLKVVVTGMGIANARRAALQAISAVSPQLVLTCGFAGGLAPSLSTGDVVFDTEAEDIASRLLGGGARRASFLCVSRIAVTAQEKLNLRQQTGRDAVEMESEVIRSIATEQQIPSATVRVILDPAEEDLPLDFNLMLNAEQEIQPSKLALAIAKAPNRIPALIKFGRQSRVAAEALAKVLESFFR